MSIPTTSFASSLDDDEIEKTNLSLAFHRYKDRFTNFPKDRGWISETQYFYQGYWFPSMYLYSVETVMHAQETFQADPSDIYLITAPKSGTTWLKALTFAIVNRARYNNNSLSTTHPLLISNPHSCVPLLEMDILRSRPTYTKSNLPRIFATHTPYTSLPRSILDSGCRLVYMYRNPKDVLVSLFHFINKLRDKSLGLLTLEEAFEMFAKGNSPCGPFWDHVKAYYIASLEQPKRILFLTYENLNMDTKNNVKKLAQFLGYPFTKEEEAKGVVQEIVSLCSFKNLREVNKHGILRDGVPNNVFFREGKVGDWINYLPDGMRQTLDQITEEKFHGLDIVSK